MNETTPQSSASQGEPKPTAGTSSRSWVILVVDDEPDILASFKQLLEQSDRGIQVLTASTGREGLRMLETERIDLVMSDFKMPGMDGLEFLFQARRLRPGLPRIMFTAFASDALARRAVTEALVSEFISKNVEPMEMINTVEALLAYGPGQGIETEEQLVQKVEGLVSPVGGQAVAGEPGSSRFIASV